jgi:hypothetical protein
MTSRATLALIVLASCAAEPMTIDEYACPRAGTELTYDNFGRQFLDVWCMRCHAEGPNGIRFDDRDDVLGRRERIFINAAGPNTYMPPGPDDPSEEERAMLAEWLACGAP